ncbi:MAG: sigma-70 family RNA polymerase sigma factor [Candidatus Diapherotrites archaeon]|nr:sigma-70 family RNA polymerase sigma factor [Candidatus Diapherotrites archaeon]
MAADQTNAANQFITKNMKTIEMAAFYVRKQLSSFRLTKEDLISMITLKIIRNFTFVADRGTPKAYIFIIARHLIVDTLRKKRIRIKPTSFSNIATDISLEDQFETKKESGLDPETRDWLIQNIMQLPYPHRTVLLLKYEGMTNVAIARHLGIRVNPIAKGYHLVKKAHQILRDHLEKKKDPFFLDQQKPRKRKPGPKRLGRPRKPTR